MCLHVCYLLPQIKIKQAPTLEESLSLWYDQEGIKQCVVFETVLKVMCKGVVQASLEFTLQLRMSLNLLGPLSKCWNYWCCYHMSPKHILWNISSRLKKGERQSAFKSNSLVFGRSVGNKVGSWQEQGHWHHRDGKDDKAKTKKKKNREPRTTNQCAIFNLCRSVLVTE